MLIMSTRASMIKNIKARIAIVIPFYTYPDVVGGAEIFTQTLARELARKSFEVHLIAARGTKYSSGLKEGVFCHAYRVPQIRGITLFANLQIFKELLKIKPNIIIGISHRCLPALYMFKRLTGINYAIRLIGPHFYKILFRERLKSKSYIHYILNLMMYKLTRYECIFIVQNSEMDKALKQLGITKIRVIQNPIEPEFFNLFYSRNIDARNHNIVFVGRLVQEKGVELLVRAFAKLVERIPEARLFLVGDGPEKSHLQYLAERMGIAGRIIFTGFVPHSKVRDFLREASVFVLPSRFEGLPNALLQAMAAGLPCIATSVGGVPDVIENGINGILIPPGREDLLAEALEKVLIDQDLARRLGENAHRSVSRLRLDRIVGSYHRLIIEMLSIKND